MTSKERAALRAQANSLEAVFQAGTLYLDGRSCDLCVKVLDAGKHGASVAGALLVLLIGKWLQARRKAALPDTGLH